MPHKVCYFNNFVFDELKGNDMGKTWFKKFLLDLESVEKSSLKGVKKYLRKPYLWDLNREPVARGVAIGLFIGIIPIFPFQTLLVILLSIFLRGNLPIAFLTSWISNPLTIIPITYFIYFVGNSMLGNNINVPMVEDFTWNFANFSEFWTWFSKWIYQFGKAFFIGLPIVSIGAALIGYFIVSIIWYSILFCKRSRG